MISGKLSNRIGVESRWRGRRVRATRLSPSEIMTILIHFHQSHYRTFKAYYTEYILIHRRPEFPGLVSYNRGNCSDLRGSEQLAAGGERVQASCAPGAEDGCQRHLPLGTTFRPGAAADLAADNQMAPAALGGVVVRRHVRFGHEDEEFLDVALDAPAQPALQS